ncbi:MAG: ATP-binding protein [Opitutaceae bacterium]|nr:ATP-binding protein [Opitutaceae bacterium]
MSLQHLPLDQIKEADLQRLVSDQINESRSIDYKREWRLTGDSDKREFLFDAASFANAGGGDLVYGIEAKDGVPLSVVGLTGFNSDAEQLRSEETLARGIAPRLAGVTFQTILVGSGKTIFIVRIPRSWSAPHMVTFGDADRFYSRHSTGRFRLDVTQLRTAFLQSAKVADRIRDFRLERISRIAAGEVGVKLWSRVCVVWHLMPLEEWTEFDYSRLLKLEAPYLRPMGNGISGWGEQINFDGLMIRSILDKGVVASYVQVFRNGCIEAVLPQPVMEEKKLLFSGYEDEARVGLHWYRQALHALGITPPYFVALSLLNVGGFTMYVNDPIARLRSSVVIDRPHLLLPEVAVESEATSLDEIVRPIFDLVWNACGFFNSPNFGPDGKWKLG